MLRETIEEIEILITLVYKLILVIEDRSESASNIQSLQVINRRSSRTAKNLILFTYIRVG